jgi:hypothetical protein
MEHARNTQACSSEQTHQGSHWQEFFEQFLDECLARYGWHRQVQVALRAMTALREPLLTLETASSQNAERL